MTEEHKPLKPGMVLGPDGKPCRVCTAFRAWRPATKNAPPVPKPATTDSTLVALGIAQGIPPPAPPPPSETCPPDGEQLGRATWAFLHTTAAYYPERPDPLQRRHMHALLTALPTLYPCSHCAAHLGETMKASPPDVSSRAALSRWLCEQHNEVNEMLGKARFDCAKTDERWKDGPKDGSCD